MTASVPVADAPSSRFRVEPVPPEMVLPTVEPE